MPADAKNKSAATKSRGEKHRELMAARGRAESAAVSDIGELPAVADPERRAACERDLRLFLTTYFPQSTGLSPFSPDHDRVIARIQRCVLHGGRFVNAVYRGFAKSTISENTAIWATVYGHRRFVPLFGADATSATNNLESIKLELSDNDLLYEDFPEVCHAIRALEGRPQRRLSQSYGGELTHIEWNAEQIRFPAIPGAAGSGATICTRGITAGFRGLKVKLPDGTQQRPDLVLLDDIQTDETAGTPHQVAKTLNTLRKAILKLGGHRRQLAIVCNATVIAIDDAIDHLLDDPSWQGERIPMVKAFPDGHTTLWLEQYADLRRTYNRDSIEDQRRAHQEATAFYMENRAAMDAGGAVSWDSCYDPETEASALQHAYNILIDDGEAAFASECQQDPLPPPDEEEQPDPQEIAARVNRVPRWRVPAWATRLTAGIDVQGKLLYYVVAAWADDFSGAVVDYGTFPDQKRQYFTLHDAKYTLALATKVAGLEAQLYAGLEKLTAALLGGEWTREDAAAMRVERCVVDANWGQSTEVVKKFCRQSAHAAVLIPSHGTGIVASSNPLNDRKPKTGERVGLNWYVQGQATKGAVRALRFDSNYWKNFLHARLATPMGGSGAMTLYGDKAAFHTMYADHLCAELRIKDEGRGRQIDIWKERPERRENHWFDCTVQAAIGASMLGCSLRELPATKQSGPRQRVTIAEMRERAARRRAVPAAPAAPAAATEAATGASAAPAATTTPAAAATSPAPAVEAPTAAAPTSQTAAPTPTAPTTAPAAPPRRMTMAEMRQAAEARRKAADQARRGGR